mgnify:CR=1 FL=1
MRYYLVRFWGGVWEHLYPECEGERPASFELGEAERMARRYAKLFGIPFKVVPESDFDKYGVPRGWESSEIAMKGDK